ncbi:hypothetical protein V6C53_03030 [Desulfocurvibacter africanus]
MAKRYAHVLPLKLVQLQKLLSGLYEGKLDICLLEEEEKALVK